MACAAALALLLHGQALLMICWSAFAVCIWVAVTRWRRPAIAILSALALFHLLAAFLRLAPKSSLAPLDAARWLNSLGGFDLLGWRSPASRKALEILGAIGVVNLVAAAFLVWKKRLLGFLTLVPFVILQSLVVTSFLVLVLVDTSPNAFLRTLFAIPPGLALVVLGQDLFARMAWPTKLASAGFFVRQSSLQFSGALLTLAVLLVLPPCYPTFDRLWHALYRPAADLQISGTVQQAKRLADENAGPNGTPRVFLSGSGQSLTVQAFNPLPSILSNEHRVLRGVHTPDKYRLCINDARDSMRPDTVQVYLPKPAELYSS
jgi:hypothetical protein